MVWSHEVDVDVARSLDSESIDAICERWIVQSKVEGEDVFIVGRFE